MAKSNPFSCFHVAGGATVALVALAVFAGAASSEGSRSGGPPAPLPHDPGVRGGRAGAGGSLPGLDPAEQDFFSAALRRFQEVDSVSGTINDAPPGIQKRQRLGSALQHEQLLRLPRAASSRRHQPVHQPTSAYAGAIRRVPAGSPHRGRAGCNRHAFFSPPQRDRTAACAKSNP
jgi:hypothetical protein